MSKLFMWLPVFQVVFLCSVSAQGTVPTFQYQSSHGPLSLMGNEPAQEKTTVVPTVLVPITLLFDAPKTKGADFAMNDSADVPRILRSPIFAKFDFGSSGNTQYADALLRATLPSAPAWHTLLGNPEVKPLQITVPVGDGYVLSSKKAGTHLAMVDVEFLEREIFKRIPRQEGQLIIAVTHNTAYYAYGDATVCCSWGTHGVDPATGNSFVIGSYLHSVPSIVQDKDVQPLTEQIAEFAMDPLRNPLARGIGPATAENMVSAWMRPVPADSIASGCGGTGVAARYTLLEPTDINPRSELPVSRPLIVTSNGIPWHIQNVALLSWYLGTSNGLGSTFSFPDAHVLTAPAAPCPAFPGTAAPTPTESAATAIPWNGPSNGHQLIGYWTGRGPQNSIFRLRDVPSQWDIVIVAFAIPDTSAPEGTLRLFIRPGLDLAQLKDDIAWLKHQGKKVMISLGGGGRYFTLDDPQSIPNFISSVTSIVSNYGFDGIDLDFETPSLVLNPGDSHFKHPTTPSIVNLIAALRQLHDHFGAGFLISLVPEGPQLPAGYASYGGQSGSYLPLLWGVRDILSFVDVQDYNTPPLEGLDGEPHQLGGVDYHLAMTEFLLHGFDVGRDPRDYFPPVPANKIAVGFLVGATTPEIVCKSVDSLISGKLPKGSTYQLRRPAGYPDMKGAMFWTIDADRLDGYSFSNTIGTQLHAYPAPK
ncbi:MAG TPA: glycosyl hydrolase family 18 protein [Terracidiphilus sp.]|nr:glycosyl hydrolase family 18 protein [Terracidiphilus sp.]